LPKIDLLKRNIANLPNEEQMELMRRICGVFNTNSFEVVVTGDRKSTVSLRGLYPMGALQNHCCIPNTRHHFDDQQRLHVSAAMPIATGDEFTMSYTDLLWDTSHRRQFLKATKLFSCECRRCADPLVCSNHGSLPRKIRTEKDIHSSSSCTRNSDLDLEHFFVRGMIVRDIY